MKGGLSPKTGTSGGRYFVIETVIAGTAILLTLMAWWGYGRFYQRQAGPEQPIPFSHRVHVHDKKIGCLFCHDTATYTKRAGIPPLETCMLCHAKIAIHYPPIEDLRRRFLASRTVEWVRVNWVNEFVYFPHSMHLAAGVDCGTCHGNVTEMDRVVKAHEFEMGFCISCHRRNKATVDCFTCHR